MISLIGPKRYSRKPSVGSNRYDDFVAKSLGAVDKILNRILKQNSSSGCHTEISVLLPERCNLPSRVQDRHWKE